MAVKGKPTPDLKTVGTGRCELCWNTKDQSARHAHFLTFPTGEALREHLASQYGDERFKDGQIPAIVHWWYAQKDVKRTIPPQFTGDGRD